METVNPKNSNQLIKTGTIGLFVLIVILGFPLRSVKADYSFVKKEEPRRGPAQVRTDFEKSDDEFPESRFGSSPADPVSKQIRNQQYEKFGDERYQSYANSNTAGGARSIASASNSKDINSDVVPDPQKGVQEVSLIVADTGFYPKNIYVTEGVPVKVFLTSTSKNTLCFMADAFNVKKQVRNQKIEEVMFTPNSSGQFSFKCPINGKEGTLVVKENNTLAAERAETYVPGVRSPSSVANKETKKE